MGWKRATCQKCKDRFPYLSEWTNQVPAYCGSCLQDAYIARDKRRQAANGRVGYSVTAECGLCHKPFTYQSAGSGRPRAYCDGCRPLMYRTGQSRQLDKLVMLAQLGVVDKDTDAFEYF